MAEAIAAAPSTNAGPSCADRARPRDEWVPSSEQRKGEAWHESQQGNRAGGESERARSSLLQTESLVPPLKGVHGREKRVDSTCSSKKKFTEQGSRQRNNRQPTQGGLTWDGEGRGGERTSASSADAAHLGSASLITTLSTALTRTPSARRTRLGSVQSERRGWQMLQERGGEKDTP